MNINTLPAGSQLLFARGGAWSNVSVNLRNLNATTANPLVLDSYATSWGGTTKPTLASSSGITVMFGSYGDTIPDGGYTIRNLKFDGRGTAQWGFFLVGETRNVVLDSNEITGYEIAAHFQNMGAIGNDALVIRNNHIHRNREMGMLGDANNMIIEGNLIEANNFSGSGFNHGIYLGGHARNGIVRNNRFVNNSVINGVCLGGNFTVHGQWDGLLVEGNTISQDRAGPGCYGISINDGYNSAEFFRNVVVRNNTVSNFDCAVCVRASPSIVIENNVIRGNLPSYQSAIVITPPTEAQDDQGPNPVVRNNVVCFNDPNPNQAPIRISVSGGALTGTIFRTLLDALTGECAN